MRVGLIGCGGMGNVHAQMVANCGLHITVCGDTLETKAQAIATRFGAEATTDCMGLVQRDDVDIVAITTPTPAHAPYVIAAARAGKTIFCEKPFTRTWPECEAAVAAVKEAGVKLYVGHVLRFFQEFEALRAQVAAGQIGKPGFVRTYRGGIFPLGEGKWFRDYAQSGGVTYDCIIHDFDWLRYMFGNPERIYSHAIERDDAINYAHVTMRFPGEVISSTTGSWAHPAGFRVKAEICGDQGMLQFDNDEAPISVMMRTVPGASPDMIVPGSPVPTSPYQLEWEDFLGWLRDEHPPRVTVEDAVWAVRMGLGALESARTKQPVLF